MKKGLDYEKIEGLILRGDFGTAGTLILEITGLMPLGLINGLADIMAHVFVVKMNPLCGLVGPGPGLL